MPFPSATTLPVARSMTDTWPRTRERIPSSVQKNAPKLGSSSSLNFANLEARSTIELEATTSSHSVLIKAARSWLRRLEQHQGGRPGEHDPFPWCVRSAPPTERRRHRSSPGPLSGRAPAPFFPGRGLSESQGRATNDSPGQGHKGLPEALTGRIVCLVLAESRTWVIATRRHATARRTTIADVAREAGVNKGTVSRALRGIPGVGPTTRERIIETADRLDFSASHLATALASGQSRTIGIVLPTLRSWYFSEFASGASEILSPAGFRVELINLDVDSDFLEVDSPQFRKLFRELGAGRGRDALLFAGTISTERTEEATDSARVPVLASGSPLTSVPGIFVDNRAGGRLVAQHLLGLGHRDIAILDGRMSGKYDYHVWDQRSDGLRDTVRQAGFDIDSRNIVRPGDCHAQDGEHAMNELLASGRRLPTAIYCHTDEMAFGATAALRAAGLRCPDDLSVAGFDGHPMSRWWGLTTVTQHAYEQGVRAAHAMISALAPDGHDGNGSKEKPAELRVELIVRGTTGPVPDAS